MFGGLRVVVGCTAVVMGRNVWGQNVPIAKSVNMLGESQKRVREVIGRLTKGGGVISDFGKTISDFVATRSVVVVTKSEIVLCRCYAASGGKGVGGGFSRWAKVSLRRHSRQGHYGAARIPNR